MTTETKAPAKTGDLTDRIEVTLQDVLILEQLLWQQIRGQAESAKVNYGELQLMGRLHKVGRRLKEKINEAGRN